MAEEAERVGGPQPAILNNKGLALWKLGRGQEALPYLKKAADAQPPNFHMVCNYGCLLAELGHSDEAAKMLARAENSRENILWPASARRMQKESLKVLRQKVSEIRN